MLDLADFHRTGNRYADQYLVSAERLGLDTEIIDDGAATALIRGRGRRLTVSAAILGCNNVIAARLASHKYICATLLQENGFRVPPFALFSTADYFDAASLLADVLAFAGPRLPVVLKPARGSGGVDVHAGLDSEDEVHDVVEDFFPRSIGEFLAEEHIHGRHFRVKLFDGQLVNAIERTPATVTGDGARTIRELIDEVHETRAARELPPVHSGRRLSRVLSKAGLDLDSVLPPGEQQPLSVECNVSTGGITTRLPLDEVPVSVVEYLADAARCCGLRWVGVDFIVDDLLDPAARDRGFINEMNSAPTPSEYYPDRTPEAYLEQASRVLKAYFAIP